MPVREKLICKDPSLAIQSQKDEADINTIVRNFGVTGQVPQSVRIPTYGDFSGVDDFRTAIEAVRSAELAFNQIPANIRAHFENDPAQFHDFCCDPANLSQLREWGLAPTPEPAPASDKDPVTK